MKQNNEVKKQYFWIIFLTSIGVLVAGFVDISITLCIILGAMIGLIIEILILDVYKKKTISAIRIFGFFIIAFALSLLFIMFTFGMFLSQGEDLNLLASSSTLITYFCSILIACLIRRTFDVKVILKK